MFAWLAVFALGAGVGLAELASRYRDKPSALLSSVSFWVYLLLNAGASALAYGLILVYDVTFGLAAGSALTTTRVLVAGLTAMALFRSSLFNLKIADSEVSIGPNALLTSLLSIVDRAVDRRRATDRSATVAATMKDVSFAKAKISLPAYCLQLMQNVPQEEQHQLRTSVDAIAIAEMADELRSLNLGLLLMNVVGPAVLSAGVRDLRANITTDGG